jgi:hypothetical protein
MASALLGPVAEVTHAHDDVAGNRGDYRGAVKKAPRNKAHRT